MKFLYFIKVRGETIFIERKKKGPFVVEEGVHVDYRRVLLCGMVIIETDNRR
jgi:hypothetical protein